MSYLDLLHLQREPFSNSPDPDAYYGAPLHALYLSRLEIAIHLKRGVNVILGEVGTGKSTLCRCLLCSLATRPDIETFLLLDAGFADSLTFISQLYELISGAAAPADLTERTGMGLLQALIYAKALQDGHNLVLLIDEGQKLSPAALEVLRELLNFETNTEKLLQIIIFAQPELAESIAALPNFKDRINEYLHLTPLPQKESIALVRHRLHLAGGQQAERLFSKGALVALHKASKGRPRQLMRLGHQMLLTLIMGNKTQVTAAMVQAQVARDAGSPPPRRWRWLVLLLLAGGIALGLWFAQPALQQAWRHHAVPLLGWLEQTGDTLKHTVLPQQSESPRAADKGTSPQPATQTLLPAASPEGSTAPYTTPTTALAEQSGAAKNALTTSADNSQPQAGAATAPKQQQPADSLGTVQVSGIEDLRALALIFYGTSQAERALQQANPAFIVGERQDLLLPRIEFAVPPKMTKHYLLCFGDYADATQAYQAHQRLLALNPRLVARDKGEGLRFYLLSRESFSTENRAWVWLGSKKTPAGMRASIMPPYATGEKSLYEFTVR